MKKLVLVLLMTVSGFLFAQEEFAVMELFTSEGCYSCPPADDYLHNTLIPKSETENIIPLAFHVTYWDYLGWTDEFGQLQFDDMQKAYANKLGVSPYGTPQWALNGTSMEWGTPQAKFAAGSCEVKLDFLLKSVDNTTFYFNYEVTGDYEDATLYFILTESGLVNDITAGENNGKTLEHDNVVRIFEAHDLNAGNSGMHNIYLNEDYNIEELHLYAYVKNSDMAIIGATQGFDVYEESQTTTINPNRIQSFEIFPNPVQNILNLSQVWKEADTYEIHNLEGKLMLENDITDVINLKSLSKGKYIICLMSNGKAIGAKLFVKH